MDDIYLQTVNSEPQLSLRDEPDALHIRIDLPNNCFIMGSISKENPDIAHIGVIFINPKLQSKGIAGILFTEFLKIMKQKHVKRISGYSTNINSIKAAAKVIGKQNLKITKIETGEVVNFDEMKDENYHVDTYLD